MVLVLLTFAQPGQTVTFHMVDRVRLLARQARLQQGDIPVRQCGALNDLGHGFADLGAANVREQTIDGARHAFALGDQWRIDITLALLLHADKAFIHQPLKQRAHRGRGPRQAPVDLRNDLLAWNRALYPQHLHHCLFRIADFVGVL